ncbi:MAG: hypothetical protein UY33_C0003G0012 [Candidatus Amesbacteria bacterium GW2011_GWA1_48_9]|uniref:Uncharacterized protein n=1 Tax=Candidatus Amesbacteria bacterium GW2011_GWA1_48_9 TaxID=1618355 RepID=A0A0G1Y2Y2_9BACT|nr:MAG: hypothetical protein UY33_C0003G0012 [Candidatus Amesbacteria bacterium GW2011_GWA1_48_9]
MGVGVDYGVMRRGKSVDGESVGAYLSDWQRLRLRAIGRQGDLLNECDGNECLTSMLAF